MEIVNCTNRNRVTRIRIGEAILKLLEKNPLSEVRISAIVHMAGVSRMTFYHYYDTKEAALMDYLSEIIHSYVELRAKQVVDRGLHSMEHLEFTIKYFAKYDSLLLKLEQIGCYHILVESVNRFLELNYASQFGESVYNLYFYAGALLNVFMKWLHDGKKESVPELVAILYANGGQPS